MADKSSAPKPDATVLGATIRDNIQKTLEQQKEVEKRELFKKRVELARQGISFFEKNNVPEAIRCYRQYLKVLEDWKKVPEGGLRPGQFDMKEDLAELAVISGIYWDLAKFYDRVRAKKGKAPEFRAYLDKYFLFSKGMPFEPLCSETLRKYIAAGKPIHHGAFLDTYRKLSGSRCFVATVLRDQCERETLERLTHYRDTTLLRSRAGKCLVAVYYLLGPYASGRIARLPEARKRRLGSALTWLSKKINPHYLGKDSADPRGTEGKRPSGEIDPSG